MSPRWERAGLVAALAVGAWLRVVALGADVPVAHASSSAPVEDAFWYLEAAAGVVEGSHPEPTPWDVPVWTQLARIWLRLFGASWESAHALGATVSLLTALCLWRLVRACSGAGPALFAVSVLAVLPPFVVLGRTPMIYGPLTLALLTAAALPFVSTSGALRRCRLPLAWTLVLGAIVAVRPPAAAVLGGLLALQLRRAASPRKTTLALAAWGILGGLAAWAALPTFVEQTLYRVRLQAAGASPPELLWRLLRLFGDVVVERTKQVEVGGVPWVTSGSGYGRLAWGTLLAGGVGATCALRRWSELSPRARDLLALCLGWIGAFALGCATMDARPLRYFPLVAPPLAALAGLSAAHLGRASPQAAPWAARLGAGLVAGWLASHLGDAALTASRGGAALERSHALPALMLVALLGGVPAAWLPVRGMSHRLRRGLIGVLVAVALGSAFGRSVRDVLGASHEARRANHALPRVVSPGALLVGPHASYLTLGSGRARLRAPWIRTRPPGVEPTLERLILAGATHVALGAGQAESAGLEEAFAQHGAPLDLVAVFRTPYGDTRLYRLRLAEQVGYALSAFEARRQLDTRGESPPEPDAELLEYRLRALREEGRAESIGRLTRSSALGPGARRALSGQ